MLRSLTSTLLLVLLTALVAGLAFLAQDRSNLEILVPVALVSGGVVFLLWRRNDIAIGEVLLYALLFRLLMVLLPPSLSDDAYRYVWDGLVQVHEYNPYQYTPDDPALSAFQRDPLYEQLNSKSYYTVYPPVSQGIFAFGGLFYSSGWIYSYYVIKAVLVLLELGAVFLLARLVESAGLARDCRSGAHGIRLAVLARRDDGAAQKGPWWVGVGGSGFCGLG